jgi:hypothetical protein
MQSFDDPTRRRIDAELATIALGAAAIDSTFARLRVIEAPSGSDLTDIVLDAQRPDAVRRAYDDARRNLARRGERLSA